MNVVSLKEYKKKKNEKNGVIPVKPVKHSLWKQALADIRGVRQIIFSREQLGFNLLMLGTVIILLTFFSYFPNIL